MRMWVKHDLRGSTHGPPHSLCIAPTFVANHHTEGQRPGDEATSFGRERGIDAPSDGSICPLSCHPATVPSGLITHGVICEPRLVTPSVPRMTVMRAALPGSRHQMPCFVMRIVLLATGSSL
jgi:hypothetical protein